MSYNFVDTTEARFSEQLLSTEALQFNGVWLDQAIPGFRTLTVAGRESVESEIKTNSVDARDGADYQYTRYLPRTITVAFQLGARDSYEFRALFNALNRLLLKRQGQIVFADEPDKYYIGTMTNISDVPPGRNAVTGEIKFYCADPIKYSLEETVMSSNTFKSLEFTYQGTYPTYPVLSAVMAQDCGYVTFFHHASTPEIFDENGKLVIVPSGVDASIMIGNPEEIDGQPYYADEDLVKIATFSTSELNSWSKNTATPVVTSKYTVSGSVGITSMTEYVDSSAKRTGVVSATNYGTPGDGAVWCGPTMTRAIPTDSNGDDGALNFSLTFKNYFFSDDVTDLGIFQLNVYGTSSSAITQGTKKHIAGITFYRNGAGSGNIEGQLSVNGSVVKTFSFTMSRYNCFTGFDSRHISIFKRFGDTIIFELPTENRAGWERFGFTSDALGKVKATEIDVFFGKCGSASTMRTNALRSLKFSKYGVEKTIDEPNLFSKGDVVTADCSTGTIYVNGQQRDDLGDIDNNWEDFCIRPEDVNSISAACSSWVKESPEYIIRFREAYL